MRVKRLLCVVVACALVGACGKSAADEAAASSAPPAAADARSSATPEPPKPVPSTLPAIVARVNGEEITREEFEKMIQTIVDSNQGRPIPDHRRDEILRSLLDQLVVYTLLNQEAKARGLTATEAEIDARVQTARDQVRQQSGSADAFDRLLTQRNLTLDAFRQDARKDISATKVMDAELATLPGATDADAKDFYAKNPNEFEQPEQAQASHILIAAKPTDDAAAKAKARATIDSLLKRVKAGEDFGALAKQYSADPGSGANGGDLGTFPRGRMVPAFDQAVFSLKPGQISEVVTTEFGYHIIKLTAVKPGGVVAFEEARPQIRQFLERQKKQERQQAYIEQLKKKAKVEVLL